LCRCRSFRFWLCRSLWFSRSRFRLLCCYRGCFWRFGFWLLWRRCLLYRFRRFLYRCGFFLLP
jgi:hypothetical protein